MLFLDIELKVDFSRLCRGYSELWYSHHQFHIPLARISDSHTPSSNL
jgi:hypothetical protein